MEIKTFEKIYESCKLEEGIFDDDVNECVDCGKEIDEDDDLCDECAEIREKEKRDRADQLTKRIMSAMGDRLPEQTIRKFAKYFYGDVEDIEEIARQFHLNRDEVRKLYNASLEDYQKDNYRRSDKSQLGLYESMSPEERAAWVKKQEERYKNRINDPEYMAKVSKWEERYKNMKNDPRVQQKIASYLEKYPDYIKRRGINSFEKIYESCKLEEKKLQEGFDPMYIATGGVMSSGGGGGGFGDFFGDGLIQTCNRCDKKYFGKWNCFCKKCWKIVNAQREEAEQKEKEAKNNKN
jgi:hypothetical protein